MMKKIHKIESPIRYRSGEDLPRFCKEGDQIWVLQKFFERNLEVLIDRYNPCIIDKIEDYAISIRQRGINGELVLPPDLFYWRKL